MSAPAADHRGLTRRLKGRYEDRDASIRAYGILFELTRVSEDCAHAYGNHCDGTGRPIPGSPIVKLPLNASRTAPAGYRRVAGS